MKSTRNKTNRFQFVLDELWPLRPVVRKAFGFTFVYIDDVLLLGLRDSHKQPNTNGIWLFTFAEHLESLRREFASVPRHHFWKSGEKGWVILAARLEHFEETAFQACELILRGDKRIGRTTRALSRNSRKSQFANV
jgi:hypothetical protein